MRMAVFCAFLVCLAAPATGQDTTPRYARQYGLTCLIQMHEHHPADVWGSLPQEANAIFANRRVAAAFVAGRTRHPDAESLLTELLNDPDMIVRRIAAQSLFGVRAFRDETARRYRYAEVLAAEERARALADEIARHGLKKEDEGKVDKRLDHETEEEWNDRLDAQIRAINRRAYEATRELIALGRPAAWQLHLLCSHPDEEVALSAAYAFQEIDRRAENVAPLWAQEIAQEIKPKLEKPVSFDFKDKPVADAMVELSRLGGIEISFSPDYEWKGWDGRPHLITLTLKSMSLGLALKWILRLHDLDYTIANGGIVVGNVDAYRTPTPETLRDARKRGIDVVGPENADYLHGIATCCDAMVVAWGALPLAEDVDRTLAILRETGVPLYHLGLTQSGRPRHPLYVLASRPLEPFGAMAETSQGDQ